MFFIKFYRLRPRDFCKALGLEVDFVQDNQSHSKKGVLRGLHFQMGEYAQAKLVSVLEGRIQDVAVDMRKDSPTFGQYVSMELSSENKKQVFIPRGFAHGFLTLSDQATVFYKCDNYYNSEAQGGIRYNDPTLNIEWNNFDGILLSNRDKSQPFL